MSLIDLSHVIRDGLETYPGLPVPRVGTHLSREAAESTYGPGVTFHIGVVEHLANLQELPTSERATRRGSSQPVRFPPTE